MSLINRMLQDLEQRSGGDAGGSGMPRQIRAVQGGDGNAQRLVLGLIAIVVVLAIGAGAWLYLRQPALLAAHIPAGLKISADLSAVPTQAPQTVQPAPVPQTPLAAPAPVAPVAAALQPTAVSPPPSPSVNRTANQTVNQTVNRAPNQIAAAGTETPLESENRSDAPPAEKPAAPARTRAQRTKMQSDVGADTTAKIDKQVKELTPPQRAENAYRAAAVALQQGRQAEAIDDLNQALQLDEGHAAARQMLVGLLLAGKRTDEAARIAQQGLALDSAQIGLAMILARVQLEQGNLSLAIETMQRSLPHAQDHADYQALLAALLQRDKRHKEAIEHYIAALGREPQSGVWWMGLGISLLAENRLPEAREAFSRAKTTNTLTPQLQAFVDQKLAQLR